MRTMKQIPILSILSIILISMIYLVLALPSLLVTSPSGTYNYGGVGTILSLNWTINGDVEGCWYEYNNTNTTIYGFGVPFTDAHGESVTTTDAMESSQLLGITIRTNTSYWISNITRVNGVNATHVFLIDSLTNATLATSDFVGNVANIRYQLEINKNYSIVVNSSDTYYKRYFNNAVTLPKGTQHITFVSGRDATGNTPNTLYNIASVSFNFTSGDCQVNTTTFTQGEYNQRSLKFWTNLSGINNFTSTSWNYTLFYNSENYSNISYETSLETFSLNVTGLTSASLIYDGTEYSASVSNNIATKSLVTPLITSPVNKSFYWKMNGGIANTTVLNQTVNPIQLGLCNSTLNVPYINFTFKDESTDLNMSASADLLNYLRYYLGDGSVYKNFLFTNTSLNPSYAFCFSPSDKTMKGEYTLQYASTGYPQRIFYSNSPLTNVTTNQSLYLLSSANGIYSTLVAQSSAFTPISGVTITAERQFSGVWTLVSQGTSDASGAVTFWVNPNYDHRFTATKSGYSQSQVTIRPTQSQYTIILGSGTGNTSYSSILEGIKYDVSPRSGFLNQNTTYAFTFNITASLNNLVRYKLELSLINGSILSSAEGVNSAGSNLSISYNTGDYGTIYGKYSIDIGTGYYQIDPSIWAVRNITAGQGSIWNAVKNTINYRVNIEDNYGQLWWLFFFLFLGLSAFTYFTGAELTNPGIILIPLFFFIMIFSFMGFFTIDFSPFVFMDKYGIAMVSFFLVGGFLLGRLQS